MPSEWTRPNVAPQFLKTIKTNKIRRLLAVQILWGVAAASAVGVVPSTDVGVESTGDLDGSERRTEGRLASGRTTKSLSGVTSTTSEKGYKSWPHFPQTILCSAISCWTRMKVFVTRRKVCTRSTLYSSSSNCLRSCFVETNDSFQFAKQTIFSSLQNERTHD